MNTAHEQLSLDSNQESLLVTVNGPIGLHVESNLIKEVTERRRQILKNMGYYSIKDKVIILASRVKLADEADTIPID